MVGKPDGEMNEQKSGWIDGKIDNSLMLDKWDNGWMDRWLDGWKNEWINRWEQMDKWMDK